MPTIKKYWFCYNCVTCALLRFISVSDISHFNDVTIPFELTHHFNVFRKVFFLFKLLDFITLIFAIFEKFVFGKKTS